MLTREQILAAPGVPAETVDVPEWGGTVGVRSMSGTERDIWERRIFDQSKSGQLGSNMRAVLVSLCAVDDAGARLFTDADIEALGAKDWQVLDRVVSVAMRLNKLNAADVEATEKNS